MKLGTFVDAKTFDQIEEHLGQVHLQLQRNQRQNIELKSTYIAYRSRGYEKKL